MNATSQTRSLTYSVQEAADLVGVSEFSIRRLLSSGAIPCIRVGTNIRIPVTAVDTFINTPTDRLPKSGPRKGVTA